jgi:N-acetylglucosaminyldiphosphoundecaprenol N-acetyl-beta-D-mannosaminyltransferase
MSDTASEPRQTQLMGLSIDALTEAQVIDRVLDGVAGGSGGWICPVNLEVLRQCVQTAAVCELVQSADIVVADGMPLLWASRAAGAPLPERVAGSSLTFSLTAAAAERGASVYLLGGSPGAADGAAIRLKSEYPSLQLAGTACPPFGFEHDARQIATIECRLEMAKPDIVFVGLGFPKQDWLAVRLHERFPRTWFVSCGISLSFASGQIRRAPRAVQVLGLEWVHRLAQQPRTLFRRYLIVGVPFAARLLLTALAGGLAKRYRRSSCDA